MIDVLNFRRAMLAASSIVLLASGATAHAQADKKQPTEALRVWKQYLIATTDPEKRATAETHIHLLSQ